MRRGVAIAVLLPLLGVGLVSFLIVRSQQGEGAILAARQQNAAALTPGAVASVVRVAPDPVTRVPGRAASCQPRGSGELHNPWRCTIRYRSGRVIQYRITITARGSYSGDQEILHYRGETRHESGQIVGCCVIIP